MIKSIIIILLIFPSISFADEWTNNDSKLQIMYSVFHIIDWNQTIEIGKSKEYQEDNIVLGKNPNRQNVNQYFLSTLILHYIISINLDRPYRTIWQGITIVLEQDCIRNNIKNGFKIKLNF